MASPRRTTGSLYPTFVPGRLVCLTVKHPYAIALRARLPFVLRVPWEASVTLLEATTPVKLPTKRCPLRRVRTQIHKGPYFTSAPRTLACPLQSLRPILHIVYPNSALSYSKGSRGLFRPVAGTRHHHRDYNFTELTVETVSRSLHHSCRSELTRQGISLP